MRCCRVLSNTSRCHKNNAEYLKTNRILRYSARKSESFGFQGENKRVLSAGYKRVARISTGLTYEKYFEVYVRKFFALFGFEITKLKGTMRLVESHHAETKISVLNVSD